MYNYIIFDKAMMQCYTYYVKDFYINQSVTLLTLF